MPIVDTDHRIERAKFLYDQRRWKEAEAELRRALAGGEDRAIAQYWLAWALWRQDRLQDAEDAASAAIAADPEMAHGYYVKAVVLDSRNQTSAAEQALRVALRKDPSIASFRAKLGWILLRTNRPYEALELANDGLRENAEAVNLHQVRTEALGDLHKTEDAEESAKQALSIEPRDEVSLAQLGSLAARRKDYRAAQEYFASSLRISPTYTYARDELLKTMRSRTWIYRLLIPKKQSTAAPAAIVGILYGGVLAVRGLMAIPGAGAIAMVVLLAMVAFLLIRSYASAAFHPLSALAMRLNPLGRAVLSRDEIRCSNYVGLLLAMALLDFVLVAFGIWLGLAVGLMLILLVIPVAKTFQETGRRRTVATVYTSVLVAGGAAAIVALAIGEYMVAYYISVAFLLGCTLSGRAIKRLGSIFGAK